MPAHKCNKCFHQAFVKTKAGHREFCLAIDFEITELVKNCSEYDNSAIREPEDFLKELDNLVKNPNITMQRKINRIKKKVTKLRSWGKQGLKPKMRKKTND